jgi:hypothetical protein
MLPVLVLVLVLEPYKYIPTFKLFRSETAKLAQFSGWKPNHNTGVRFRTLGYRYFFLRLPRSCRAVGQNEWRFVDTNKQYSIQQVNYSTIIQDDYRYSIGQDMTGSVVCLQLGGATCSNTACESKVAVSTMDEFASSRDALPQSSLEKLSFVVNATDLASLYSPMELANWVPLLRPDATVSIKVVGENADLQPVHTSFLLAGLSSASERRETDGSRVLTANRKKATTVSAAPLKKASNAVQLSLDDDDDMIDEDNLLADDVLAPPPAMGARTATDDCSGRKACDDCTCGRADAEASDQPKTAPSSSCGKCTLGDAFRCASCPYLGKPAFKAGEEHLVLDMTDDF